MLGMTLRAFVVTLAALGALTACSSGPTLDSGAAVADELGCAGWTNNSSDILITEGGDCRVNGQQVYVYYFADNDARDNYVSFGSDMGALYLIGDHWAVDGDRTVLEQLQGDHGGEFSG